MSCTKKSVCGCITHVRGSRLNVRAYYAAKHWANKAGGWKRLPNVTHVPPTSSIACKPGTVATNGSATLCICLANSLVGDTMMAPT